MSDNIPAPQCVGTVMRKDNAMNPLDNLRKASKERNSEGVELALHEHMPNTDNSIELLSELLESEWHQSHESIALELQRLKNPKSINALKKVAERKFEYLEYNNSEALARKCTWALADIGTKEAKEALEQLSLSKDEALAIYAKTRLINWERELGRKNA